MRCCSAVVAGLAIVFAVAPHPLAQVTGTSSVERLNGGRSIVFLSNEHLTSPTAALALQGFREVVQDSPRPTITHLDPRAQQSTDPSSALPYAGAALARDRGASASPAPLCTKVQ